MESMHEYRMLLTFVALLLAHDRLVNQNYQPFLSYTITDDKKAAPHEEADLHQCELMLCIWRDKEGIYYELPST